MGEDKLQLKNTILFSLICKLHEDFLNNLFDKFIFNLFSILYNHTMQIYGSLCFSILVFIMHPFLTTHYPLDATHVI